MDWPLTMINFMIMKFIPSSFFNIDKIQNEKDVWNQKFIHFMQMLTLKQSLHLSKVYENIHDQKDKQKLPLVDPSS